MTIKKRVGITTAGIALLVAGCVPEYPEGDPLFAPVDGQYDKAAVVEQLKSPDKVMTFTPEVRDLLNEFYAFTGHHEDLREVAILISHGLLVSDEGDSALGKTYPNGTVELAAMPLSNLLLNFFHEAEHVYNDWSSDDHDRVAVAEQVFRPVLMYAFDPQIGTSFIPYLLVHRDRQEEYINLFWARVGQSGDPINEFNFVRNAPKETLDSASAQAASYLKTFPRALERMRETGSLASPEHATPGEIDTYLAYLLSRLQWREGNDADRQYLEGLQRTLTENVSPNPFFLMKMVKPNRPICREYQSVVASAVAAVDLDEWPVFFGEDNAVYIQLWKRFVERVQRDCHAELP